MLSIIIVLISILLLMRVKFNKTKLVYIYIILNEDTDHVKNSFDICDTLYISHSNSFHPIPTHIRAHFFQLGCLLFTGNVRAPGAIRNYGARASIRKVDRISLGGSPIAARSPRGPILRLLFSPNPF